MTASARVDPRLTAIEVRALIMGIHNGVASLSGNDLASWNRALKKLRETLSYDPLKETK